MKKYVFTVKDEVCTANGKDVNATKLLEVMRTYGVIEDYDKHVATIKAEYQAALDSVVAQNEAIKEQNLSAEEIELVNEYRKLRAKATQSYINENSALKKQLSDIRAENETRISKIAAILATAADAVK